MNFSMLVPFALFSVYSVYVFVTLGSCTLFSASYVRLFVTLVSCTVFFEFCLIVSYWSALFTVFLTCVGLFITVVPCALFC